MTLPCPNCGARLRAKFTLADLVGLLSQLPSVDDEFWDDLEAINKNHPRILSGEQRALVLAPDAQPEREGVA